MQWCVSRIVYCWRICLWKRKFIFFFKSVEKKLWLKKLYGASPLQKYTGMIISWHNYRKIASNADNLDWSIDFSSTAGHPALHVTCGRHSIVTSQLWNHFTGHLVVMTVPYSKHLPTGAIFGIWRSSNWCWAHYFFQIKYFAKMLSFEICIRVLFSCNISWQVIGYRKTMYQW